MRSALAMFALSLAVPATLDAQWSVTAQIGVHVDRLRPAQRVLIEDGSSTVMMSAPGEAPVFGLRGSRSIRPHLGVDAGIAISQNHSWSGGGAGPLPDFVKRTTFTSVSLILKPLRPHARGQLELGVGPALIFHGGSGRSVLTRQTDIGVVATAAASWALSDRIRLGVDAHNYRFPSRFDNVDIAGTDLHERSGTRWRSEWLILPSVRIRF